jgi:NADH:ubiquinone oxidoreductase subunit 5 (subunit L)/multisubunit Na+/H+ antiporter MnhA subunit
MPHTYRTFVIGTLALAGIFPLAGFWSKDEILVVAGALGYKVFIVIGIIGAFMTAAYMTRCVYLTFHGEYRGGHEHHGEHVEEAEHLPAEDGAEAEHGGPHESNGLIVVPLYVLSFFAIFAGILNFPKQLWFEHWFAPRTEAFEAEILHEISFNPIVAAGSVAIALAGIGIAWAYYTGRLAALRDLTARNALAARGKSFLVNKLYLDHLYEDVIVAGIRGPIANAAYWVNQHIIDNVLNYTGRGARAVGRFTYDVIDQQGVDGAINGLAVVTNESGGAVRRIQTGRLQFYALLLVAAVGLFAAALWIFT